MVFTDENIDVMDGLGHVGFEDDFQQGAWGSCQCWYLFIKLGNTKTHTAYKKQSHIMKKNVFTP